MKIAVCVKQVPEGGTKRIDPQTLRLDRSGEAGLNPFDTNAIEEALRASGSLRRRRDRARLDGPRAGRRRPCARGSRWAPTAPCSSPTTSAAGSDLVATSAVLAKALEREGADLVLFGQQASDSDGAVLCAAVAERLRLPLVSQVSGLELKDGAVDGEAADGVRLRPHRGAAAGGRRRLGRDQRASLPVAEGDHGCEVEAAGEPGRRRARARRGGRRARAARARRCAALGSPPPRGDTLKLEDDGSAAAEGRRPARREEAAVRTLVFLEHHDGADPEGLARRALQGGVARRRGRHPRRRRAPATRPPRLARTARRRCTSPTRRSSRRRSPQPRVDVLAKVARGRGVRRGLLRPVGARRRRRRGAGRSARRGPQLGSRRRARRTAAASSASVLRSATASTSTRAGARRRPSRSSAPAASIPVPAGGAGEVVDVDRRARGLLDAATLTGHDTEEQAGPSIEEADIIVAGGRGLGGPEGFAQLEELAKALGGAVAATRAVVDAGWYPYATQVGQTGKTVAPKLYIACGISGAIQHKVGMQSSGHDRRRQQGSERADLRVLRHRRRRRPEPDRSQADGARPGAEGVSGAVVRPADYPPPLTRGRRDRRADRSARRADRGRRARRRRGPGRARVRDPARPARSRSRRRSPSGSARCRSPCSTRAAKPGAHLLSGAVVNPISLRSLFAGRRTTDDMPFFDRVEHESRLLPHDAASVAHPGAADDAQPRQLRRVALAARSLAGGGGGGARRRPCCPRRPPRSSSSRTVAWSASARATAGAAATASRCRASSRARTSPRR